MNQEKRWGNCGVRRPTRHKTPERTEKYAQERLDLVKDHRELFNRVTEKMVR